MDDCYFVGTCILIVGLINLADAHCGGESLRMMSSIYPGADTTRTLGRVLLGTVYGFINGAIVGWLFGLLATAFGHDHLGQDRPNTRVSVH